MGRQLHIIVVDDDEAIRELIVRLIGRVVPAANILAAGDGTDALHMFAQHGADLLVTDQLMPQLNGLDLIEQLRARGEKLPVLLISAVLPARHELERLGDIRAISKPFEIGQVEEALRSIVARMPEPAVNATAGNEVWNRAVGMSADYSPTALTAGVLKAALALRSNSSAVNDPISSVH